MLLLASGLILFFAIHALPWSTAMRSKVVQRFGNNGYRSAFSIISLLGFGLIIYGKSIAPYQEVWLPPLWTRQFAVAVMPLSFIILAAAYLKSNLKRVTRHPMLWGVLLWSLVHLLANGDLASILLFASFAIYAVFDMLSANRRGAKLQQNKVPVHNDLLVIIAGLVGYGLVFYLHPYLFRVAIV